MNQPNHSDHSSTNKHTNATKKQTEGSRSQDASSLHTLKRSRPRANTLETTRLLPTAVESAFSSSSPYVAR